MAFPAIMAALKGGAGAAGASAGPSGALQGMAKALGGLKGGAMGTVNRLNAGVQKMGAVSGALVHVLAAGSNTIKGLAAPLAHLVSLRSPAIVKQFELAIRDMEATLGQIVLPIFEALTRAARDMGDTYATLAPKFNGAIRGISDGLTVAFKAMGSAARGNAGAIQLMADAIGEMAKASGGAISVLSKVSSYFLGVANVISDLLGFQRPEERSAKGAAIRNISIGGATGEDVARRAQEAAFAAALGQGPQEAPEVTKLTSIETILNNIRTAIGFLPTKDDVKNFLSGLGGGAGAGALAVAGGPAGAALAAIARGLNSNRTR